MATRTVGRSFARVVDKTGRTIKVPARQTASQTTAIRDSFFTEPARHLPAAAVTAPNYPDVKTVLASTETPLNSGNAANLPAWRRFGMSLVNGASTETTSTSPTATTAPAQQTAITRPKLLGNRSLKEVDPTMYALIEEEKNRQLRCVELIASENFTSQAVLECLGSVLTNKYSEGQPGNRYYGGNDVIDKIENLCKERALEAYGLDKTKWGVNVQPYSGSPANFAVYTALLEPHDRIMGLDLPSGGHLTHGYYTPKKKISATSIYFASLPYKVHPQTGRTDFDDLRKQAMLYRPKMIICGASAYPRELEFAQFRAIADDCGALLHGDVAHISGLIATGEHPSPFDYCDVVTTTTHKSLRGPRAGMIFFRYSDAMPDIKERIDMAVFPALQGGPHNNAIGALAAQLREVNTPEFVQYSKQVKANAKALGDALMAKGHKLATDGTDNHLVLWDLRPHGLTGSKVEKVCDAVSISLNRNCVHGDKSALSPGGVRIGAPSMTTRGCDEAHFKKIAEFLDRVIKISLDIQAKNGKKLKDFERGISSNADVGALRKDVEEFAFGFGFPGI